jgi:single-stranded DNA-binding protein
VSDIDAAFFGVLGKDPERKTSQNGKPYVRLSVRVGSGDGAQWVQVLAFNELDGLAELTKGDRVYCEGPLSVSAWLDQRDGKAKPNLTVLAWKAEATHRIGRNRGKQAPRKNGQQLEMGGLS